MRTKAFVITLLLMSCGEGTFNVNNRTYEPKIVIDGYLFPGSTNIRIYLQRNVPISGGQALTLPALTLKDAQVSLTDQETGDSRVLSLSPDSAFYTVSDGSLRIAYHRMYRLDVSASIDGHSLAATAVTLTPDSGFGIRKSDSVLDSLPYNAKDGLGLSKKFKLSFNRSEGTEFYFTTITALQASAETFVYSPVNIFTQADSQEVRENLEELAYQWDFTINTPATSGVSSVEIEWFYTMFYGDYRVILYAGDRNMRDFLITYDGVQEADGNLHEPVFAIEGDGIGVFGSAIADTVYLRVTRPDSP